MNKCLVTKLNGSSSNSELLRLGEMRIKILKVQNPTDHTQGFSVGVGSPVTLEIINDGYFTNQTLTENKGKSITLTTGIYSIWVNGTHDVEIAVLSKYNLTRLFYYYQGESIDPSSYNIKINISDLKYSNALSGLDLSNTKVSGSIDDLKSLTALTQLQLNNTQVSGDISNLKSLTALTQLQLNNTKVSGSIDDLKSLTALSGIYLDNTQVSGNISSLKSLPALKEIYLSNTQTPIIGDIGKLSTLSKCTQIFLRYSKLTGDLAAVPALCRFISFLNDKGSVFTWSTRPSTAKILAIEGSARLSNIDKMLQDQAQCQVGFSPSDSVWFKTISVVGNRTSASDAAVAALQQKGYTVKITNV